MRPMYGDVREWARLERACAMAQVVRIQRNGLCLAAVAQSGLLACTGGVVRLRGFC